MRRLARRLPRPLRRCRPVGPDAASSPRLSHVHRRRCRTATGRITGRVVSEETNDPLRNARVVLVARRRRRAARPHRRGWTFRVRVAARWHVHRFGREVRLCGVVYVGARGPSPPGDRTGRRRRRGDGRHGVAGQRSRDRGTASGRSGRAGRERQCLRRATGRSRWRAINPRTADGARPTTSANIASAACLRAITS